MDQELIVVIVEHVISLAMDMAINQTSVTRVATDMEIMEIDVTRAVIDMAQQIFKILLVVYYVSLIIIIVSIHIFIH